jgi:hypothetical protein
MTAALAALDAVTARLDAATLADTLALAELQTRFDRKYVLTAREFHQLQVDLHDRMEVLDIDGRRCFRYESVYFDTPQLSSYFATARDRRHRFKVRTRAYLDSRACAFEVKTTGGRGETAKERIEHPFDERDRITDDAWRFVAARVPELDGGGSLTPVLTTRYRRATLVDRRARARVTCDAGLECVGTDGRTVTLDGFVLVETKSTGAPTVADRLLWAAGRRPVTISKFGVGMAALDPRLPANKWNRALRRYFGWTPAR